MQEPLELFRILVPASRPDKIIKLSHHKEWDEKVRKIASGLTILTAAKGQWVSASGDIIHDRVIPVEIACTEKQITEIAEMTLLHYNQDCVMVNRVSDKVMFFKAQAVRA